MSLSGSMRLAVVSLTLVASSAGLMLPQRAHAQLSVQERAPLVQPRAQRARAALRELGSGLYRVEADFAEALGRAERHWRDGQADEAVLALAALQKYGPLAELPFIKATCCWQPLPTHATTASCATTTTSAPPRPAAPRCASAAAAPRTSLASRCKANVLETGAAAGITSYEPSELVVTVRAGTPAGRTGGRAGRKGQCLPFEPPHFGALGERRWAAWSPPACPAPRAPAWAAVRDYVLGVSDDQRPGRAADLWRPGHEERGRLRRVAPDVRLLGTLGLITEVSLKVLPVAVAEATLRFRHGRGARAAASSSAGPGSRCR
jgi:hypothetical protein